MFCLKRLGVFEMKGGDVSNENITAFFMQFSGLETSC